MCFSTSIDGEQLSLVPLHEPGEQRQDSLLLCKHSYLFSIEPLLHWALSSTCPRASGLFPWAAVAPCPSLCLVSLPLSPIFRHWPWFSVLAGPPKPRKNLQEAQTPLRNGQILQVRGRGWWWWCAPSLWLFLSYSDFPEALPGCVLLCW